MAKILATAEVWRKRLPCWVAGAISVFYATEVIVGATTTILRGLRPYSREDGMMEVETWEARTDICRPMPRSSFGRGDAVWYASDGNLLRGHVINSDMHNGKTKVLISPCDIAAEYNRLSRPEDVVLEEDIMSKLTGIEERELRGSQKLFWEQKLPCWVESDRPRNRRLFVTEMTDNGFLQWIAPDTSAFGGVDPQSCRPIEPRDDYQAGDKIYAALLFPSGYRVTKATVLPRDAETDRDVLHIETEDGDVYFMRRQDAVIREANAGLPFPRWLRTTCFGAPWAFFATEGNEASVRGIDLSGRRVTVPTDTCGPPTTTPRVGDKVYIYRPETGTVVWGAAESEVDGALLVHIGMGEPIQRRPVHEVLCAVSAQRAEIDPPRVAPLRVLHTGMRVRVRGVVLGSDVAEGTLGEIQASGRWRVNLSDGSYVYLEDREIMTADDQPLIPDDLRVKPMTVGYDKPLVVSLPNCKILARPDLNLRRDLARHFGLSADAPDRVVFDTAKKAWDGDQERRQLEEKRWMHTHECLASQEQDNVCLRDKLGTLDSEARRLRRENTELLAENARLRRGK